MDYSCQTIDIILIIRMASIYHQWLSNLKRRQRHTKKHVTYAVYSQWAVHIPTSYPVLCIDMRRMTMRFHHPWLSPRKHKIRTSIRLLGRIMLGFFRRMSLGTSRSIELIRQIYLKFGFRSHFRRLHNSNAFRRRWCLINRMRTFYGNYRVHLKAPLVENRRSLLTPTHCSDQAIRYDRKWLRNREKVFDRQSRTIKVSFWWVSDRWTEISHLS